MSSSSHFDSAIEVLDWAGEAIQELKVIHDAFFNSGNFRELREFDADASQNILKVKLVSKLPSSIPRKATEALLHIKHSFDRSLYAACLAIGKLPKGNLYFPWAESPDDLEYRLGAKAKAGKVPKLIIPKELWDVLRGFEPYGRSDAYTGGNNLIRELAKIANRKHTLRLNFSAEVGGIEYPAFSGPMTGPATFEMCKPHWDTVKNEVIIAKFPSSLQTDYKYALHLGIAFNEAPPLKGKNLIAALNDFLTKAQTVLERLSRETDIIARH